jgi:uncharacterized membrane protein YbhN (UPF0104 family)
MRAWVAFGLKAALSCGVLAVILAKTDVARLAAILGAVGGRTVALALALIVVQSLVTAYRWVVVMAGVGIRIEPAPAVLALYASLFINQGLPSYVGGDAYRIYWVYREGNPLATAVRGVLIDRVSALVALVAMMVVTLPRLFARFPDRALETGIASVAAAGVVGTVVFLACDALPRAWSRVRVVRQLAELSTAARRLLVTGRSALVIGPLALLLHALSAAIMYVFAADMRLPLTPLDCLVLIPPVMLLSAIPISVSGWGVREGVMVGVLSMLGIAAEQALALSVLIGCVLLANGLIGALPLAFGGKRFVAARGAPAGRRAS